MSIKTFRLQLRFLVPLALTLAVAAYIAQPLLDQVTLRWFSRDLEARGQLVANSVAEPVTDALQAHDAARLRPTFERVLGDERLLAVALCDPAGRLWLATGQFPLGLGCAKAQALVQAGGGRTAVLDVQGGRVHVGLHPVMAALRPPPPPLEVWPDLSTAPARPPPASAPDEPPAGAADLVLGQLLLLHDLGFIDRRSADTRQYLVLFITGMGLVIALITMAVAQFSWRGWVKGAQAILRGEGLLPPPELRPLADALRTQLRDLEDEYRRLQGPETDWDAGRLRSLLGSQLSGDQVIVVSNREPYIHERGAQGIVVKRPASGLITAVEPVMRACSGTWIAHGSGNADREVVDAGDGVAVPPGHADYRLRRIWLTAEEEQGYYYGLANEGLWPLCHVAHVRPVFRAADWEAYRAVNQRFADAVVAEARSDDPIVLVQDYHFALLPAMIRERLPQATIITFWHIPWPNPESFGICPWRRELLQGMLGSSILGFHTRYHCKNFIETVDRYLEARIEHEHSTISFQDKETLVESYPISIAWPEPGTAEVADCRQRVFERLALPADACLALGVDRIDYTKGILERLNAVERLLEKHPQWIGRFVMLQVAAPTRSALDEYRSFQERIARTTQRINQRFGRADYQPVLLLAQHHEPEQVRELMRAANICVVTSLHDGMNLVCKEFVAERDDEQGVLLLSRFAGAARELTEALIINPYHVEETADALHRAATMPPQEQRERMVSLRSTVREFNVYRWAGRMLTDAARWRLRERVAARVRRMQAV